MIRRNFQGVESHAFLPDPNAGRGLLRAHAHYIRRWRFAPAHAPGRAEEIREMGGTPIRWVDPCLGSPALSIVQDTRAHPVTPLLRGSTLVFPSGYERTVPGGIPDSRDTRTVMEMSLAWQELLHAHSGPIFVDFCSPGFNPSTGTLTAMPDGWESQTRIAESNARYGDGLALWLRAGQKLSQDLTVNPGIHEIIRGGAWIEHRLRAPMAWIVSEHIGGFDGHRLAQIADTLRRLPNPVSIGEHRAPTAPEDAIGNWARHERLWALALVMVSNRPFSIIDQVPPQTVNRSLAAAFPIWDRLIDKIAGLGDWIGWSDTPTSLGVQTSAGRVAVEFATDPPTVIWPN